MVIPLFLIASILLYKVGEDISIIITRYTTNNKLYPKPEDFKDIDLYKLFNEIANELETSEIYISATSIANRTRNSNDYLNIPNTKNNSNPSRFNSSEY